MLEPPGTMRTRSASVVGRTGYVSLSKNRRLSCADMSTSVPMRKPSRMPCLTHALTHHVPSGARSAARISPRVSAPRNSANAARSASLNRSRLAAARGSMRSRSDMGGAGRDAQLLEHRAHPGAGLLLHGNERQAVLLLEQAHQRQRRLYRPWVRFDEVGFHE